MDLSLGDGTVHHGKYKLHDVKCNPQETNARDLIQKLEKQDISASSYYWMQNISMENSSEFDYFMHCIVVWYK